MAILFEEIQFTALALDTPLQCSEQFWAGLWESPYIFHRFSWPYLLRDILQARWSLQTHHQYRVRLFPATKLLSLFCSTIFRTMLFLASSDWDLLHGFSFLLNASAVQIPEAYQVFTVHVGPNGLFHLVFVCLCHSYIGLIWCSVRGLIFFLFFLPLSSAQSDVCSKNLAWCSVPE